MVRGLVDFGDVSSRVPLPPDVDVVGRREKDIPLGASTGTPVAFRALM